MKPTTGLLQRATSHIKTSEFDAALSSVWQRPKGVGAPRIPKLALAVSGGVDSMALVVLCRRMNRDFHNSKVKPRAFVVDHAARSGSDVEATQVARNIAKLGTVAPTAIKYKLNVV
ncbi:MAG: hypothetical protein M1830_007844 [Pleopsidium flavum]|nr:MAG: hypothetical protein M1830_007844 [Pleopsidium flavum]